MNVTLSMVQAVPAIAKAEGFFADEGIDLELVRMDSNSALFAFGSERLDVITNPVRSGLFNMMARGVPFQLVVDNGHSGPGPCSMDAFTAPPELAERIRQSGLRGQRVATIKGGLTEFLVGRLLAAHHLTTSDVELVEYPAGEAATGEFRVLDAVRLNFEPNLSRQREMGLIEVVFGTEELAPGYQRNVVGFGDRLLRRDPDLGRRFMRAWLRGIHQYNQGKTARNVEIISQATELPPDLIRKVCWPRISDDGVIRPGAVEPLLQWTREHGYLQVDIPRSRWWNPTFVEAANRDLAGTSSR